MADRRTDAPAPRHGIPAALGPRALAAALLAVVAAVALAYLLKPIADRDFFWHLKTGEWIWAHRQLPASDPFSFTGNPVTTPGARLTLTGYWLSQLLLHFGHALGGLTGVVLLRAVIAAALLAVVWKRRGGDAPVDAALLLVFAVAFLERYPVERPQVLSFLFFGALLLLLESLKKPAGERPWLVRGFRGPVAVALLMLVWANAHPGFVLGQATIGLYLVSENLKRLHPALRPVGGEAYRALVLSGAAGLAASLANPNGYHALWAALATGAPAGSHGLGITEYLSIPEAIRRNGDYTKLVPLALMALAALAVATRPKRVDLTEAALAAACAYFAFKHIRHVPVFLVAVLPLVGRFLSAGKGVRWTGGVAAACALALALFFVRDERHGLDRLRAGAWVNPAEFPVAAADFIVAKGFRGNIYNHYDWGGYLIWRLGPESKVFVDGRNVNPAVFWQFALLDQGMEQPGQPTWTQLVERYDIGCAVVPVGRRRARTPFIDRLSREPDWQAVFLDDTAAVFARMAPAAR